MKRLQTMFVLFLTLCLINLCMAGPTFGQAIWYAKADITENTPVIKSLPEEKIPVEIVKGKEGGSSKILWAILGVALVGGIAAALGGGGGSGGGGDDPPPTPTTGDVIVSW